MIAQDVSVATPAVAAAPTPVTAPGEKKCQKIYMLGTGVGASFCCCEYVLRIPGSSDFLRKVPTYSEVFLCVL